MKTNSDDKWLVLILVLSLVCIFALACAWELWAEEPFDRLVGILYDPGYELQSCWWFIAQCSAFGIMGLLPGGYVARRLVGKLRASITCEQQQRQKAEESGKAKMLFLANMSHELRTPLNAIIGFSEIKLMSASMAPEKQREYTEIIHRSGQHLLSVVNDVLDFARGEEDKLNLSEEDFDIWRVLDEAVEINMPQAEKGDVAFIMPPAPVPLMVHADIQRTRQAISNLLSNAVKFTMPGGRVALTAKMQAGAGLVEISDTGIGIAPGDLERVMRPFEQVDNSFIRKFEGTGLGLLLVRRFVEAMGGNLQLASEIGKGTSARITLPLAEVQPAAATRPHKPASMAA